MHRYRQLRDEYRFPGFRPDPQVRGVFGDPLGRVIRLHRREKKRPAVPAVGFIQDGTPASAVGYGTSHAAMPGSIWSWRSGAFSAGDVGP